MTNTQWKKRKLSCFENWSRKLYDPKDLEMRNKNFIAFEENGSGIKRFRKPE
jgi:hypothetical protein